MKKIIRATTIPQSLDTFCKGMLKELSRTYEVIALSSPGEALDSLGAREGVRTIAVPMERHVSIIRDCKSLLEMWGVFRKEKPYMVHSMTPKAGLICMIAAWLAHVPLRLHTFTGLVFPTSTGIKRMILKVTDSLTCACATHIIPEGEGVKNDLINYRVTNKPLKVLGFGNVRGVDLSFYERSVEVEEKASAISDPSKFTFLFVGRIVRDKGINELIDAFKKLTVHYPNSRLFLIGRFEDDLDPVSAETRNTIRRMASIISVGEKYDKDLLAYYAASDCFILPSYREGFPNTVLEAGAMGLPCIVTDINGSREIIIDGYNGVIVPPYDSDKLYEAMRWMIDNPQERISMASVARKHIAAHYEQGFVRKCLYEYYQQIMAS